MDDATHSLAVFDGTLLGGDRGEFGGYLAYRDQQGHLTTLLLENVHGIVENQEGVFVLTGLSHLGMNEGNLYRVTAEAGWLPRPVLVGHLPGAPSHVVRERDGTVHFLIEIQNGSGEGLYRCHALRGATVSYSNNCMPPTAAHPAPLGQALRTGKNGAGTEQQDGITSAQGAASAISGDSMHVHA